MWYVYLVKCADNSLYAGVTNNLKKRIKNHNSKKGAKYTRARIPVKLVYKKGFRDKSKAYSKEYEIKQMTRKEKLKLIRL